jgi:hypothetical protein
MRDGYGAMVRWRAWNLLFALHGSLLQSGLAPFIFLTKIAPVARLQHATFEKNVDTWNFHAWLIPVMKILKK